MFGVTQHDPGVKITLSQDTSLQPVALENPEDVEFDLVTILSDKLAEVWYAIPDRVKALSEFDLCNEVDANPSEYKMRQNFADAVQVARDTGKKIRVASIYEGVLVKQNFFNYIVSNPLKMAFIMRPVVTHMQYYDAIHKEGLRKIWYYIKNYDLDPKTMATFAKLIEKAGDRSVGPVAQRIQMHQKQEVTHTAAVTGRDVDPEDPIAIQSKINEMQAKLSAASAKQNDELKIIDVAED